MASGLAARIKEVFGITPQLLEGHNGIYEVSINGKEIVTNQGACTKMPTENEILTVVSKYIGPLPDKVKLVRAVLPMV
ncbi:MAG: hypothetical protein ACOWYE_09045 [Desulfatiglandales bacterium]